jgi:hypothetical protein
MLELSVETLEHRHELYFLLGEGTPVVPVARLVPTKLPESQPDSVAVAAQRMAEAADGARPRRAPISVRDLGNGSYVIVDGNATYGAAAQAGWPDLPVVVVGG